MDIYETPARAPLWNGSVDFDDSLEGFIAAEAFPPTDEDEVEDDEMEDDVELADDEDENGTGLVTPDDEADESEAGGVETFVCAFCGEENEVFVDRTVSKRQQFTEDCEVCCNPNLITIYLDPEGIAWVEAEREDEG